MADAKIINYGQPIGAGTTVIPDNQVALEIESTDAKDYITISTVDGSEKVQFSQEVVVPDGDTNDPSLQFTANATGFYYHSSGIATTHAGTRIWHIHGDYIQRYDVTGGCEIKAAASSATAPTYTFNSDTDTGVGRAAADALSLTAGGIEGVRITEAITHATGSIQTAVVKINDAIQYNAGTGTDTATTEPVYLADTNATLTIDFANGNFGDVTLAASITAIKFLNAPVDGTVATVTAKFTKSADSTARTIDYSASAATVYSEDGDSAVTGEVLWSGGVAHTMSTGNASVDVVGFTCIPSGSTFNIYAAVIGQGFA